jgi:selenocysteine lyase/cysteine desulfurase
MAADFTPRLVPGADFAAPPGYLDTASLGVPPRPALDALRDAVEEWGAGRATAPGYDPYVQRAREAFARMVGVAAADVATGAQVSVFTAQAVAALGPGAEVVAYRGEFTSALFPLLARTDLKVRLVDRVADLPDAVRRDTKMVAFSAVQSADGAVADLAAIAAAAEHHDAITFVDATQACGWLPLDASRFDFVAVGAYKWLLSPRGTAFMAVRRERLEGLVPVAPGWYAGEDRWDSIYGPPLRLASDARRLDMSPAWLPWVGTAAALEYLQQVGVSRIHEHGVALANRVRAALGMPAGGSPIVSVPASAPPRGVRTAMREGRVRASFHLYNDARDADMLVDSLTA